MMKSLRLGVWCALFSICLAGCKSNNSSQTDSGVIDGSAYPSTSSTELSTQNSDSATLGDTNVGSESDTAEDTVSGTTEGTGTETGTPTDTGTQSESTADSSTDHDTQSVSDTLTDTGEGAVTDSLTDFSQPTDTAGSSAVTDTAQNTTSAAPSDTGTPSDTDALSDAGTPSDTEASTDTSVSATDTNDLPTDTGDSPTDTGDSPTDTGDSPTDTGDSPTDTMESQTDTMESQTDTMESQTDTATDTDTGILATDSLISTDTTSVNSGNTCDVAMEVDTLPFNHTGNTTGTNSDYYAYVTWCDGLISSAGSGSNDYAYVFSPDTTAIYTITVNGLSGYAASVYVVTDCESINTSCLGGSNDNLSGEETLLVSLSAQESYYIIVDGGSSSADVSGDFTISISQCVPECGTSECGSDGCGGTCGDCNWASEFCNWEQECETWQGHGNNCTDPFVVDPTSLPFSVVSNLNLPGDEMSVAGDACPGMSAGIRLGENDSDEVYAFTPAISGAYDITVDSAITLDDRWNSIHYVITDCENGDNTCVGVESDDLSPIPDVLSIQLEAQTTYYIVVDGADAGDEGPYRFTISDVCVPSCENGKNCGDDGCGFSCGECEAGYECSQSGYCEAAMDLGDTCLNPFVVTSSQLPYTDYGDSSQYEPRYQIDDGCGEWTSGGGDASSDVVYALQPDITGVYTIEALADGFDHAVYVVTDCTDASTTCVDAASRETFTSEGRYLAVETTLQAGTTYYIIYDGVQSSSNYSGPYSITISQPSVSP